MRGGVFLWEQGANLGLAVIKRTQLMMSKMVIAESSSGLIIEHAQSTGLIISFCDLIEGNKCPKGELITVMQHSFIRQ